jgi:hypothetical protein
MAGFGAMKKKEDEIAEAIFQGEAIEVEKQIVHISKNGIEAKAPTPASVSSRFPYLEAEFVQQTNPNRMRPSKVFCGIVGHEGTGKSGIVIDGHMHKYPDGMLWALDFDNGAMACKEGHYPGSDEQIRTWVPWVYQQNDRTAYDYPKTHDRVMDLLRYAVEYAEKQTTKGFEGKKLRTFLVTAVSQFDKMCMDIMKIYDLELGNDAIGVAKKEINQEIGWNWGIRSTRFKQLTAMCQKLNALGVDVYLETHLKEDKEGKVGFDGWKFAWEKSANADLFQIIWCHARKVRDEDGKETGETRHMAEFFKEKTNSDLKDQERLYFVTKKDEPAQWLGLSELREGVL